MQSFRKNTPFVLPGQGRAHLILVTASLLDELALSAPGPVLRVAPQQPQ